MSCCKYRLDQSGRIENVPSESVLRVEARIDISPSGLWLKMLGRCPGTWSKRFPTRGKVLVHPYHEHWKPPIPRTLEGTHTTNTWKPHNHYKDHFTRSNCWEMVSRQGSLIARIRSDWFCVAPSCLAKGYMGMSQWWWCADDMNHRSHDLWNLGSQLKFRRSIKIDLRF